MLRSTCLICGGALGDRLVVCRRCAPGERPAYRADCVNGPRPCPWVSCRHHVWAPTDAEGSRWRGPVGVVAWDVVADRLAEGPTCSLDIADDGPIGPEKIAEVFGVSKTMGVNMLGSAIRSIGLRVKRRGFRMTDLF